MKNSTFFIFPCSSLKLFVVLFPYVHGISTVRAGHAFIGANSSKIVAHWTAHTESPSACAGTQQSPAHLVCVQRSGI